jgi:glycerol kinase
VPCSRRPLEQHICRACLEAVALQAREVLDAFEADSQVHMDMQHMNMTCHAMAWDGAAQCMRRSRVYTTHVRPRLAATRTSSSRWSEIFTPLLCSQVQLQHLMVDGGMTVNELLMQTQADLIQVLTY